MVKNETTAVSAGKDSALRYGTDAGAKERSRLKISTKTRPRKCDHRSLWTRQSAAARERDDEDEIVRPVCCHTKCETLETTRHCDYEVKKGTAVTLTSKQRRSSVVAFGGRRPQRFSRCKRDRRYDRSSKRHAAKCSLIEGRCHENDQPRNIMELGDSQFAETAVPRCKENEDDEHNDGAGAVRENSFEVTNVGKVFETPCRRCARGQGMQTISEEDLVFSDELGNAINNPAPEEIINGHGENRRIPEHKPNFRSTASSPTRSVRDKSRSYSPVRGAKHKCRRCSASGAQSTPTDNSTLSQSKRIHSLNPSCTQTLSRPYNYKVSLDAFRCRGKSSESYSSIFWKIASVIYEISGVVKDGLTKLLASDDGAEGSFCTMDNRREGVVPMGTCRCGRKDMRNVGTMIERTSRLDRIQRTVKCGKQTRKDPMAANREDNSRISVTGDYNAEKDAVEPSCGEKFGTENTLVGSASESRKSTFRPKTANTRSDISGSSPFGISGSVTEDDPRVEEEARTSSRQCSVSRVIVSPQKSNVGSNKGTVTSATASMDTNTRVCENEDCRSYDEMQACTADVEDMPADEIPDDMDESEDVSSSVTTVVPTHVYGMRDLQEPSYTSKFRAVHSEESCSQDGPGFRDEVYYDFRNSSEADSSDSSNYLQRDRRSKRNIPLSTKARRDRSRFSCRESPPARNYSVRRGSGTDCRIDRPYETVIQSRIEYFKDVASEDAKGELATLELPCSKIPRLTRHGGYLGREASGLSDVSSCRHCALRSYGGAGGELQRWDQKSIEKKTVLATRRRNRAQVTGRSSRSFKSTRHRVFMCNY